MIERGKDVGLKGKVYEVRMKCIVKNTLLKPDEKIHTKILQSN